MINLKLRGLKFEEAPPLQIPSGTINAIPIAVAFSEGWDNYPYRYLQFSRHGEAFDVDLNERGIGYAPYSLTPGRWQLSAFALTEDNSARLSSEAIQVVVYKGSVATGIEEYVFAKLKELEKRVAILEEKVADEEEEGDN